jgi:hypothetical protein
MALRVCSFDSVSEGVEDATLVKGFSSGGIKSEKGLSDGKSKMEIAARRSTHCESLIRCVATGDDSSEQPFECVNPSLRIPDSHLQSRFSMPQPSRKNATSSSSDRGQRARQEGFSMRRVEAATPVATLAASGNFYFLVALHKSCCV